MLTPYPPFGLATLTVLVSASYLMLLGIYHSATLVSTNNELRRSILKHALESKLLSAIGHAEMEKEIQNTVAQVNRDKYELEKELEEPVELDDTELEKYIEFVVREVRKGSQH
jgi:HAMP domain-containing protein